MKAVRIEAYQPVAQYNIPGWTKRRRTYPLPPYSTVIGMVHAACGWKTYHPMCVSVSGSGMLNSGNIVMYWNGGTTAMTETEDFKKRFPVRVQGKTADGRTEYTGWVRGPRIEDYMADVKLVLHVIPEREEDVEKIYNGMLHPERYLSLGRHEDSLRVDNVVKTEIRERVVRWKEGWYYVPAHKTGPILPGTVYSLNKSYSVSKCRRIFTKVRATLVEPNPEWPLTYAYADEDDTPMFLA
ncbi:CRISPR-associated protein Cas5 [Clostridium sp. AF15-17LB]|nr:CRISPR-associated protein Cas5 [Clostridium sp. AF15-17LB]